jgi:hypothetical protein
VLTFNNRTTMTRPNIALSLYIRNICGGLCCLTHGEISLRAPCLGDRLNRSWREGDEQNPCIHPEANSDYHYTKLFKFGKLQSVICMTQMQPALKNVAGYIKLLKPAGYGMHQHFEYFNNFTFCPYCILCFVFVWEQTATCATYIKKTDWFL